MAYETDPRVDDYIEALPDWQQAICRQVRELVHEADPQVVERLTQRVAVVDGQLTIASPPGGPTKIIVELPLRA